MNLNRDLLEIKKDSYDRARQRAKAKGTDTEAFVFRSGTRSRGVWGVWPLFVAFVCDNGQEHSEWRGSGNAGESTR